jgi:LPXTG-motif cell wall-anchored protein
VEVTVVNKAGTELPSTGGIGTTIFYVVGGLLVIGAAVILIARRKVSE